MILRRLGPGDESLIEAFLAPRIRSSFILLANVSESGLTYEGRPRQGVYAGAFAGDDLAGIAAHYWNGNLVLQAPQCAGELAEAAVGYSTRPLHGLLGPWEQVCQARAALGLQQHPTRHDGEEILYAVALEALAVPPGLAERRFGCRHAQRADLPALLELSLMENTELFNEGDTPEIRARITEWLQRGTRERNVFLLEEGRVPIAMSLFQGRVLGTVQVGGVYTVPPSRNRGGARCVVRGSLLLARDEGIRTAQLFTGVGNIAAQRAYESLGFTPVGDYGIVLFEGAAPAAGRRGVL